MNITPVPMTDYEISEIQKQEYPEVMLVWETSVRATHHFLKEEDILFFRKLIFEEYLNVVCLYAVRDSNKRILGFLGVSDDNIEMLFIHPDVRGKGIGSFLLDYAINRLHLHNVDVNEQNEQAIGFYLQAGFSIVSRSEQDGTGKPYPILHLKFVENQLYNPKLYIITGGPGVGKTTVIEGLKARGFYCVDEVARQIIKTQMESGGNALPWGDIPEYTQLMLSRSIETYIENRKNAEITFFDRGIPDTLAYAHLTGLEIFPGLTEAAERYRYNLTVFILPPWTEIYQTDKERKQSFREAVDTYEMMKKIYAECGYRLIEVPKLENKKRIDFILSHL